jgi:histidyl-tRNA synthetase
LREYFEKFSSELCADCKNRLTKSPMRVIDCKKCAENENLREILKNAPLALDNLCDDCREHFNETRENLDNLGINYGVDSSIVRGLDYYTRTVFEISAEIPANGSSEKLVICGGGRYNGLLEELGGKALAGVGFGIGIERLIAVMSAQNVQIPKILAPKIFIAAASETARKTAQALALELRKIGIFAEFDVLSRSLKAQMKYADKLGSEFSLVVGDKEITENRAALKNMRTKIEIQVNICALEISKILKNF